LSVIRSMVIAFATYSRIPMPRVDWAEDNRRYTMCFFPLIGLVIGLLMWGWLALCDAAAFGPLLKGAVGALLPLGVTGGIHMDGLMDTADAMASWQPKERRLEILKDSHVGAFGVMSCAGYLLLSAGVISEMTCAHGPRLVFVYVVSRALSAWALTAFPNARPQGMLGGFSRAAHRRCVTLFSGVYLALCALMWCFSHLLTGVLCLGGCALVLLCYRRMAMKYFGGVTGDLAGWFLQITELTLAALILVGGKL